MKMQLSMLTVLLMLIGITACSERQAALNSPPGKYESRTSSTDANGTTYEHDTSTNVTEDEYGNKKAVIHSKTTKDPRGLFNKTTTNESNEVIDENQ